jgi:peptidoglycan/LPS O-acetylase OafA/YrhL
MSRSEQPRETLPRPPAREAPRPSPRRTNDDVALNEARRAMAAAAVADPATRGSADEPPARRRGRRTLLAVPPRPVYLPALDGLRAVSVAAVVAFHLGRLPGGFIGVDVFFVISGFLITRLLLIERERTGRIDLPAFWGRRFRRLLPALFLVLVAVAVAARSWMESWRLSDLRADALSTLGYVANWRFVLSGQSYFTEGVGPSPLRHAWSLAIEEQFYVIWPLVVMLVLARVARRYRLVLMAVAGVGALASAAWMAVAPSFGLDLTRLYYGTDSRAFALLAGAWLAAWWDPVVADAPRPVDQIHRSRPLTRVAGVALVPLAVLAVVASEDTSWFYRVGFQAVAVLSTVAVAGLATGEGPVSRALGHPVPCWLGRRSYGIYLWSWPIQVFATSHFAIDGLALDLAVIGLTLVLATLSFRFVEEPIRRMWTAPAGRRAKPAPTSTPVPMVVQFGVGALGVCATILVGTAGATPVPGYMKVSDEEAAAGALETSSGFSDLPDGEPTNRITTTEPVGDTTTAAPVPSTTLPLPPGPPGPFPAEAPSLIDPSAAVDPYEINGRPLRIMIAGDSVGWSLGWDRSPEVTDSIQMEDRAIIGCGVMPPESSFIVRGQRTEQYSDFCLEQDRAEGLGLESGPDVVLLWVGAWEVYDHELDGERYSVFTDDYAQLVEQRLQERIDRYRAAGVPTVMPTVPCFGTVSPNLGQERYDLRRRDWVNDRLLAVAARNRTWVRVVDPRPVLCDEDDQAIETTSEGLEIRADGAHFDSDSAAWFWNTWLAGQLGAAYR